MDKNVTNNSGLSLKQGKKKMKEKARLEAAFESATLAEQMSIALKNMIRSKLFEVRGLDFGIWKLAQQSIAETKNQTFGASSSHRNKIKLKQAFHYAKSGDEILKAYHNMESCFEEELAIDCWRLTQQLSDEKQDPEKVLCYALGRGEEAVVHVREIMETHEKAKTEGSIDKAIDNVVQVLEGLGLCEQNKVIGAVRLLKEMKENDSGGDSLENSNCGLSSSS